MMCNASKSSALGRRHRLGGAVASVLLLTGGVLVGCEDSAAEQRVDAQRTILAASADFRNATVGTVTVEDEEFESRQQELNALIGRVSNLPNADPGQQAAGGMLAAEALSELASMHLAHAQTMQRQQRFDRRKIQHALDAAGRLSARADAQAELTTSSERAMLQGQRDAAEESLNELNRQIGALEGPIADRLDRNAQDVAEADRLREEANDLIRLAIELGHANGFPSFQQAIDIRRDADGIDFDVSLRELELEYELQPQHELVELQIHHLRSAVESIRNTLAEFDRLDEQLTGDLDATRQQVSALVQEISRSVDGLSDRVRSDLAEQYEQAGEYLQRAVTQARQAAGRLRGDQAGAARMLQVKVSESLGSALKSQAAAMGDHADLLTQLIEVGAGLLPDLETYRSIRDELNETRQRLTAEAREAFAEAQSALGGVSGSAADAYRSHLERVTGNESATEGIMNTDL